MSFRNPRRCLATELAAAASAYQVEAINPRCATCKQPCCRLDPLVLELDWQRLKALWRIEVSRTTFDKRLAAGHGPAEIRAMDGIYYAHRKVCPAYDETRRSCRVYNQALKPPGCTDFPVYADQDCVIADLRCEAVDIMALTAWIAGAVGKDCRIIQSADEAFPFMVTLSVA